MTDRKSNSLTDHHDKGWTLAGRVSAALWGNETKDFTSFEDVRQTIDDLAETTQLQVTIADFWLNLSKYQSQERRKQEPPANPFQKIGKERVGIKSDIRAWDSEWLAIEHLREGQKIYGVSGTWQARAKAAEFATRIAVLTSGTADTDVIVGFVNKMSSVSLAQVLQHPERLQVAFVTMDEAMVRRWWNKDDQMDLIDTSLLVLNQWRDEVDGRVVVRSEFVPSE